MEEDKYIWENDRFRKDPYQVPEGYFEGFQARLMARLNQDTASGMPIKRGIVRPWMVWVSGIAAAMVIGWFGVRTYYWKPMQEIRFQEKITLLLDFFDGELHEGQLAGYFEENTIDVKKETVTEVNALIQIEPDLAEEYIYESVGL